MPCSLGEADLLKIPKTSANPVDIELAGGADTESMRIALDELIAASEDVRHGHILYKISDFSMPTLGAIGVEIARLPKLFGLLAKFDKCAVLSDSSWLRKAAAVEGAVFRGIDIKAFEFDEVDAAEAWLGTVAT